MARAWEASHVCPQFGENDFSQTPLNPNDRFQSRQLRFKGAQTLGNLVTRTDNGLVQGLDMLQMLTDQEAMLVCEHTSQRLLQHLSLRAHLSQGQLGKRGGCCVSFQPCLPQR